MTTTVLTTRADVAACAVSGCRWRGPLRDRTSDAQHDARQHDRWHESFVVVVMFSLWWGSSWEIAPMIPVPAGGILAVRDVSPLGLDRILRELGLLS